MPVLLIRHGESEANQENIIVSYKGNPGLTEAGTRQAWAAAKAVASLDIQAVYASPLKRTQQTAQAFLRPGMTVQVDERLHEINLGRWDGMKIDDIEMEDHDRYHQWKLDPEMGAPEGGEALSVVAARVRGFLADVHHRHGEGWVIAATHSDCMKAALLDVLGGHWTAASHMHLSNTAGLLLDWRDNTWQWMVWPLMPPHQLSTADK
jgi:broad specificity phosphatase PhoE